MRTFQVGSIPISLKKRKGNLRRRKTPSQFSCFFQTKVCRGFYGFRRLSVNGKLITVFDLENYLNTCKLQFYLWSLIS